MTNLIVCCDDDNCGICVVKVYVEKREREKKTEKREKERHVSMKQMKERIVSVSRL